MDEQVAAHRLANLMEGLWCDAPTAAALIRDGLDPTEFQQAIRERLVQIADGGHDE